jgi:hypothetical protein
MERPWQLWMMLLVSANFVLPLFFLGTLEGIVVLAAAMVSLFIMMNLFSQFGFVRLLGVGHIPWLFTVPWLIWQLGQTVESGPFYYWLLSVVVVDSLSLVIDAVDVVRYWRGERQPTVTAGISSF